MLRKLFNLFRSRELDADIREELEFHRSQTGGSFGHVTTIQEKAREASTLVWLETIVQDVRYGFRQLRRTPVVSAAAILSLALGIGANTAIFSLVNALLLRSLPVSHPEDLSLFAKLNGDGNRGNFSYPAARELIRGAQAFSGILVTAQPGHTKIAVNGADQRVTTENVSANYFDVLGLTPAAGRFFARDEGETGASDIAVISYGYWQRQFGLDPAAIGKTFEKDGYAFTIIGAAPPEFFGMSTGTAVDLWTTFARTSPRYLNSPGMNFLQMIGRRKPGVTAATAQAEAGSVFQNHNRHFLSEGGWTDREKQAVFSTRIVLEPGAIGLASSLRLQYSRPLQVLLAITGLVLLIACANIANLLLARGTARGREIGMRLAIGAGRSRLVRQLVTESLLLATLGGTLAIWFAYGGATLLVKLMSDAERAVTLDLRPDWRVFLFTAAAAVMVGLLFGLLPAVRSIRAAAINERSAAGQMHRARLGKSLIAFQVALTMVLVAGSGLFLRTLLNLQSAPLGYQVNGLYKADFSFKRGFADAGKAEVYGQILDRIPQIPGVVSASYCQPFGGGWTNGVTIPSYSATEKPEVYRYRTAPGFFATMGVPIFSGRDFMARDGPGSPRSAIVNRTLAARYFREGNPVGQLIQFPGDESPSQIVGVVGDARVRGLRNEAPAIAYTAIAQGKEIPIFGAPALVLKLNGRPPDLAAALKEIHPSLQLEGASFVSEQLRSQLARERILALLSSFFGGLAMLLACIGLFGNLSYVLARRRTEIGVRLALGARPRQVVSGVLGEYSLVLAVGLIAGIAASLGLSRLVRQFLFGVTPNDPVTIAVAAAVLAVVALLAAFLPARRASLSDPLDALRGD